MGEISQFIGSITKNTSAIVWGKSNNCENYMSQQIKVLSFIEINNP